MIGNALRQLIILLPLAYFLARFGGIGKVWYGMWVSEGIAAIYCIFSVKNELKRKVLPLVAGSVSNEGGLSQ